jgi:hypothetical protein
MSIINQFSYCILQKLLTKETPEINNEIFVIWFKAISYNWSLFETLTCHILKAKKSSHGNYSRVIIHDIFIK